MLPMPEDREMNEDEIRARFGSLINEAVQAFAIDANYAADIAKKAKLAEARKAKRKIN